LLAGTQLISLVRCCRYRRIASATGVSAAAASRPGRKQTYRSIANDRTTDRRRPHRAPRCRRNPSALPTDAKPLTVVCFRTRPPYD